MGATASHDCAYEYMGGVVHKHWAEHIGRYTRGGTQWVAHIHSGRSTGNGRHTMGSSQGTAHIGGVHKGRYTRAIVVTAKGKQPPHSDAEEGAKDEPHKCLTKTYAKTSAEGDGLAPTSPMK